MIRKLFGSASAAPASSDETRLMGASSAHDGLEASLANDFEVAEAEERARCRELLAQRADQRREAERNRGLGASKAGSSSSTSVAKVPRHPNDAERSQPVLLTVIRSALWTLGHEGEDLWQVEICSNACVYDVKCKIEELYEIPVEAQRLQLLEDGSQGWANDVSVEVLAMQPFYLVPVARDASVGIDESALEASECQAYEAAMQENAEACRALEESLKGVRYSIRFLRPESAGGIAPGKSVQIALDALTLIAEVQAKVEVKLFGAIGRETLPVLLTFNGNTLPPHMPLHFTGVGNGDTVIVASELPQRVTGVALTGDGDDSFDAAMRSWAAGELSAPISARNEELTNVYV